MKFEEKLMKLRKENAMSQEELGDKLNVTRQTVSKWELGQTKPDTDKLAEIAKLFNTTTDDLLNEEDIKAKKQINPDSSNKRNIIIVIILVVVLLLALGSIPFFIFSKVFNTGSGLFNKIFNTIDSTVEDLEDKNDKTFDILNKLNSKYDIDSYNSKYENSYTGLKSKFFTEQAIKAVIENNIKNERKITVTYNGTSAKESEELISLKSSLDKEEYLITYEYDKDGYINQMNIKDV